MLACACVSACCLRGHACVCIDRELSRLNIDIHGPQETRIAGSRSLKEQNNTCFFPGDSKCRPAQTSWC